MKQKQREVPTFRANGHDVPIVGSTSGAAQVTAGELPPVDDDVCQKCDGVGVWRHKDKPGGGICQACNGSGRKEPAVSAVGPLKLDLGAGTNKRQDNGPWTGVDSISFPGVDVVCDLTKEWPWEDESVTEAHASHFLEHLTNLDGRWERVHFFNELHRVLIPGGKATIIIPHWASCRYWGDPTHKEGFSEFGFYYLLRDWRLGQECGNCSGTGDLSAKGGNPGRCSICNGSGSAGANAPHADSTHNPDGYSCDFDAVWGYQPHPQIALRSQEAQQFAFQFYKEAIQDLVATLTKRPA